MGFFDDIAFGHVKVISEVKFKQARATLGNRGMSLLHRNEVEKIFLGDLYEPNTGKGIDKKEFEDRIKWIRENKNKHSLSDKEIDLVEEVLNALL